MAKVFFFFLGFWMLWVNPVVSQENIAVKKMPFCSVHYSEIGSRFYKDSMVFCSNRKGKFYRSVTDQKSNFLYDIYLTSSSDSAYGQAVLFSELCTDYNDGPATFNASGDYVVFASNQTMTDKKNKRELCVSLYECKKDSGFWLPPVPLALSGANVNAGHPCLNSDASELYFVSDSTGGYGGFDIYCSKRKDGHWQAPENLGPVINGEHNELFPFLHSSGRLYFASDRIDSLGFDIYYSDYTEGDWKSPVRLEEPINTRFNDFSFICDETTENGYFSSDREGSDDIFRFYSTFPAFDGCDTMVQNEYCYTFFEKNSQYYDSLMVVYDWTFPDSTTVRGREVNYCFPGAGVYRVSLTMTDTLTGEVFDNGIEYNLTIEDAVQPFFIIPDTVNSGDTLFFDASQSYFPFSQVKQYYWFASDGFKAIGEKVNHSFEKPGAYTINLGVELIDDGTPTLLRRCVYKSIVVK